MFRLGGLVVDFDDWNQSGRIGDLVKVADGEHETDHEGELHDAVQSHSKDHAMGDSCPWSLDFVACLFVSGLCSLVHKIE
jgi:hypothetical protein